MLAEIFGMDGVIVLVVVVAVLFGGSQIPKLAHSLGSARKEFKKGLDEGDSGAVTIDTAPAVVKVDAEPKA
ncbi:MAG TPA: twin-arginine translocase TatA/TatE family subunit [Acidimicrobiales bacterium]|nr:twin-arginine translocase TatA/TatE family subunit [Acidimicrobiales bacterium]